MRLWITLFVMLCMSLPLHAGETAADAEPFPGAEFFALLAQRQVELTAPQVKALRSFLTETKPRGGDALADKLKDNTRVGLQEILPHLVNKEGCQPVLAALREQPDALLRFVANCGLAGSGDTDAAAVVHALLHDERLAAEDQRALKTWAVGAGINPSRDDAQAIQKQLMNLLGKGQKLKPGDSCPDFTATTDAGAELSFAKLKGKLVVLHFWSSSCAPCLAQMPRHIEALSKLPKDDAVIVFISLDEDQERFAASVEKYALPFHNVCDAAGWGGPLAKTFGVKQLPFDIVIDRNGKVFSNSIEKLPPEKK